MAPPETSRPPLRYAKPPSTSRPTQNGSKKRVRRDVFVQCDRCKVSGTGRSNGHRITEYPLPQDDGRHRGCNGVFRTFDNGGAA